MRTTRLARHPSLSLGMVVLLLSQACFSARPWRAQQRPWDWKVLERAEQVRVQMVDGNVLVLAEVTLEESAQGTVLRGTIIDDEGQRLGAVVLPAYEVDQLETRRLEALRVAAKVGVWVGIVVVGVYVLLVITVSCAFGGHCPPGFASSSWPAGSPAAILPQLAIRVC